MFKVLRAGVLSSQHVDPETAARAASALQWILADRGDRVVVEVLDSTGCVIWAAAATDDQALPVLQVSDP